VGVKLVAAVDATPLAPPALGKWASCDWVYLTMNAVVTTSRTRSARRR